MIEIEFAQRFVQPAYEVSETALFANVLQFDEFRIHIQTRNCDYENRWIVPEAIETLEFVLEKFLRSDALPSRIVLRDSADCVEAVVDDKVLHLKTLLQGSATEPTLTLRADQLKVFASTIVDAYARAVESCILNAQSVVSVSSKLSDLRKKIAVLNEL